MSFFTSTLHVKQIQKEKKHNICYRLQLIIKLNRLQMKSIGIQIKGTRKKIASTEICTVLLCVYDFVCVIFRLFYKLNECFAKIQTVILACILLYGHNTINSYTIFQTMICSHCLMYTFSSKIVSHMFVKSKPSGLSAMYVDSVHVGYDRFTERYTD